MRECHANKAVEAGVQTSYVHSSIVFDGRAVHSLAVECSWEKLFPNVLELG